MSEQTLPSTQDVVICGGGFAGLLLARQLRQQMPELSVAVIDKMARPLPDAAHKVGESSVELGCQYLEELGLKEYLLDQHLVKLGLRFFPGGGELPLHERMEIGPCSEPVVRSYQMDRGKIENDLREMNVDDGVTMIEGAKVGDVDLAPSGNSWTWSASNTTSPAKKHSLSNSWTSTARMPRAWSTTPIGSRISVSWISFVTSENTSPSTT